MEGSVAQRQENPTVERQNPLYTYLQATPTRSTAWNLTANFAPTNTSPLNDLVKLPSHHQQQLGKATFAPAESLKPPTPRLGVMDILGDKTATMN